MKQGKQVEYFTVDRRGFLSEGARIILEPNGPAGDNEIIQHIGAMFPEGFSRHGMQYFRDGLPPNITQQDYRSGVVELLLEGTRRAHYPEKPSRYQSLFAFESLDAARSFRAAMGMPPNPIFSLHAGGRVHRGDMALYSLTDSWAAIDHRLHLYWQGKTLTQPGYTPKWECLLELPIVVGEKVA